VTLCEQGGGQIGAVYSVYGDENHDERRERVLAVAWLFGGADDWASVDAVWRDPMGVRVSYASGCETDAGDFANTTHSENQKIYADLAKINDHCRQ
jgi:hypothetical protein